MGLFLLKPHHKVKFSSFGLFFQFLDFEFHILPKIEVTENFPRFLSFQFWVQGKIENLETSEMGIFLLKPHQKVKVFSFRSLFQFLDFEFHILPKIELKNFPRFPSFQFCIQGKIKQSEILEMGIFLLKPHHNIIVSFFLSTLQFLDLVSYTAKKLSKIETVMCQTVSIHEQH